MAESPDLRVLVVDDEVPLATIVASYLDREGFATELAHDGPSAVAAAHRQPPDLVVLDVMLPGFDGVEACRRIRGFSDCYIIMLTAKGDEIDKILGLSMGADDYLVKPFSPRELVARVRAMLRRPRTLGTGGSAEPNQPALVIGDLTVDELARQASLKGRPIDLTRTEFDLLAALAGHPGRAFSRRQLIDQVWGDGWYGDEHIVDVHIGHLRRKLDDDPNTPRYIRTVRGVGYGLVSP